MTADIDEYERSCGYRLDPFQRIAMSHVEAGASVLVSAPTGSGKTAIAEFAIDRALRAGKRAFYTTPIKALSNQKHRDLTARYGTSKVGLLTGDHSILPNAPVVVMTTEVLRNMCYEGKEALSSLAVAVLDEVHYLQDSERGAVWEETIMQLDSQVRLVCLSATVSNADEFGRWISSVHGRVEVVADDKRPVPLDHSYLVGLKQRSELHKIGLAHSDDLGARKTWTRRAKRALSRLDHSATQASASGSSRNARRPRSPLRTPRRHEVIRYLSKGGGLPAIYFLFSRAACDDAVRQCVDQGLALSTVEQSEACLAMASEILAPLSEQDRDVLGIEEFVWSLGLGFGAHHAGMVPIAKTVVEECFAAGNLPVVFATETLAMGINMPAKTVVLERLTKYDGTTHRLLRGSDYAQLTGRAGRRGLDRRGESLIMYDRWTDLSEVLDLVYTRAFPLRSSFRPSYNMVANLVARHDVSEIERILRASFAQFQADERADRLAEQLTGLQDDGHREPDDGTRDGGGRDEPGERDGEGTRPNSRERRRLRRIRWIQRDIDSLRGELIDVFRRQYALLERLGYLEGGSLTGRGIQLRHVHGDTELIAIEALNGAVFDGPVENVAALASALVYQGRRDDVTVHYGSQTLQSSLQKLDNCWVATTASENHGRVTPTRELDASLAGAVQAWASGSSFATLAETSGIAAGDLVRHLRQVADLLRQLDAADPDGQFGKAERLVMRGLVRPFDPAS
ncbi:MAG: DEAD/DEAH box helicase [Actinobacteria bacterium]|nr:DEAD/DEAH box helicase [Actinomycetota bacterium]MCB9388739.1 DEAD/DEAH box helicase [Acidimicrobiia bacterium]